VIKTQEENDKFLKRLFQKEVLNEEVMKEAFIQLKGEHYVLLEL
jgi:pimeloyl-CoA synthetase